MPAPTDDDFTLPPDLKLEQIIKLPQVAKMRGTSVDTIKRHEPHNIIQLSPRRLGMRLKHALRLAE
jgi:hypothetical protein